MFGKAWEDCCSVELDAPMPPVLQLVHVILFQFVSYSAAPGI